MKLKQGPNVIQIFVCNLHIFCNKLVFVKIGYKKLAKDRHSSLVQTIVNYGHKKYHNINPRKHFSIFKVPLRSTRRLDVQHNDTQGFVTQQTDTT